VLRPARSLDLFDKHFLGHRDRKWLAWRASRSWPFISLMTVLSVQCQYDSRYNNLMSYSSITNFNEITFINIFLFVFQHFIKYVIVHLYRRLDKLTNLLNSSSYVTKYLYLFIYYFCQRQKLRNNLKQKITQLTLRVDSMIIHIYFN